MNHPSIGEDGDTVIYASGPKRDAREVETSQSRVIVSAAEYDRLAAIEIAARVVVRNLERTECHRGLYGALMDALDRRA